MSNISWELKDWRVSDDRVPGGAGLVVFSDSTGVIALGLREDNAHLVAAAPDLLAACHRALAGVLDPDARKLVKAPVAKAEGGAA